MDGSEPGTEPETSNEWCKADHEDPGLKCVKVQNSVTAQSQPIHIHNVQKSKLWLTKCYHSERNGFTISLGYITVPQSRESFVFIEAKGFQVSHLLDIKLVLLPLVQAFRMKWKKAIEKFTAHHNSQTHHHYVTVSAHQQSPVSAQLSSSWA